MFPCLDVHMYVFSMYVSPRVYVTPCAFSFSVYVPAGVRPLCMFVSPGVLRMFLCMIIITIPIPQTKASAASH